MSNSIEVYTSSGELVSLSPQQHIIDRMEQTTAIRTYVKSALVQGIDYGVIPGCGDKPTLLLPGAQKALMFYNSYPTFKVRTQELNDGHADFQVKAVVIYRPNASQIGEGVGSACTKEKKFRRGGGGGAAMPACPKCGEVLRRSNHEEGYYCWTKHGGCGGKFPLNDPAFKTGKAMKTLDESAWETRNTVLKMAKKRALVDAALTLGCLGEMFTQDLEENVFDLSSPQIPVQRQQSHLAPGPEDAFQRSTKSNSHPNQSGYKTGKYANPDQVFDYRSWLDGRVELANERWAEKFLDKQTGELRYTKPLVVSQHADNHLFRWCVRTERLPLINDESDKDEQSAKQYRMVSIVFCRSKSDRKAVGEELNKFFCDQFSEQIEVVYKNHPELAPPGYFEDRQQADEEAGEDALDEFLDGQTSIAPATPQAHSQSN